ncbi:sensor domain-containing phosphodiesterase [Shewanella aestuarii]|uniref:EAL domain-containing protein n=1 Tax=Shewanella aestuarii TaxID=1028752 RepID=A0A6G9QKC0_9GAMM|nr:EAL domain-containing protein [Shewanella aestuarii]QIR14517.1 EAL domain-containing protein [Shewanella aestuarii]
MVQEQYKHFLELIVNSSAKQQGNFTKASELVCELLQENLDASFVSVWLFDQQLIEPAAVVSTNNVSPLTYYSKRLIASFVGDNDTIYDVDNNERQTIIKQAYFDELRHHRYVLTDEVTPDCQLIKSYQFYKSQQVANVLDVAIRINGHIEGVISLESTHHYDWQHDEIQFVIQCADQLALTLATRYSYDKTEQINLLRNAVEQSDRVVMLVNTDTLKVDYVNFAHQKMTGLLRSNIEHHSVLNLDIFRNKPKILDNILASIANNETVEGDVELTRKDGSRYWLHYHVIGFTTDLGNRYALVSSYDNSAEYQHKADLERLAWHCSLTGLHNRSFFMSRLDKATTGVLLLIDLLGFKRFNDTNGHSQGDSLLIEVARRLKHFAANQQALAVSRIGSDEFCLLLPKNENTSEAHNQLDELIKKLMTNLAAPILIGREKVDIKTAIAVVDIESIIGQFSPLSCADIALQHAKHKSVEQYQFFNQDLLAQFQSNAEIERDLQLAIKGRQFELYYQPLMDLQSHKCIGAEALIRWNHPKKGVLYPGAFIEIAEKSGMINSIGHWVLETACKQLNLWQHKNVNIAMHVNVAARQFFSGDLFERVWDLLNRYRIKPGSLILEITETELMGDIRYATILCQELVELGVGIAIDDFGTGYSSMKYLKQFPITKLKIDRSFIMDIDSSKESREIVSAIIAMAKALNISLTAEGVETAAQEQFLEACACDHAQGYLYSPAIRVNEFNDRIITHYGTTTH